MVLAIEHVRNSFAMRQLQETDFHYGLYCPEPLARLRHP